MSIFCAVLSVLLLTPGHCRADVPFFWLDKPTQRTNRFDPAFPKGTGAGSTAPAPTPTPTQTPYFTVVKAYGLGGAMNALSLPVGVEVNSAGQLIVADRGLKALKVFDTLTGNAVTTYALVTPASGANSPGRMAIDATDNLYVCNAGFLQKYSPTFTLLWSVSATPSSAGDATPAFGDVALHPNGWVIVTDNSNSGQERFMRYGTDGTYQARYVYHATTTYGFGSVDANPGGQLMFLSTLDRRWVILNEVGTLQSSFGDWPMFEYTAGSLFLQDGRVLEVSNFAIIVYSATGSYVGAMATTGSSFGSWGDIRAACSAANGHFFVAEIAKARVLELSP